MPGGFRLVDTSSGTINSLTTFQRVAGLVATLQVKVAFGLKIKLVE